MEVFSLCSTFAILWVGLKHKVLPTPVRTQVLIFASTLYFMENYIAAEVDVTY